MAMQHFDPQAQAIVDLANQIAQEFDLEYVGTEHILLAILRHGANPAARVLGELGATEAKVRAKVDELVKRSLEDTWVFGRLPGSPHFRNVVARAIEEAQKLGAKTIGSEHLLLALMGEVDSTAQQALEGVGVGFRACREAIMRSAGATGA